MIAAYGPGVLDLPALLYVQLYLNLGRQRLRRAAEVALGLELAQGSGPTRALADALCETREEARDLYLEMCLARRDAAARRKGGV
jgi:hypothetical protein